MLAYFSARYRIGGVGGAVSSEAARLRRKNRFQGLQGCPGLEADLNAAPEGWPDQWVEGSGTGLRQGKKSPAGTVRREVSGPRPGAVKAGGAECASADPAAQPAPYGLGAA